MIKITDAKFLISSPNLALCPDFGMSEVAFLGRSNVGKSSLINALTGRNSLAKSSSTPGKTQLINFFEVAFDRDGEKIPAIFVDLPGFGYAKVSKSMHADWHSNLNDYLKNRPHIRSFVHLVDARHFDLEADLNLKDYLRSFVRGDQKILTIYTKADKLNQSAKAALRKADPAGLLVSTLKKTGLDEAREAVFGSMFA